MNELLKIVLSLSLSGTLLFLIMLVLKPLYKNKLSKRWQYYIWLIVIARMLLPFTSGTTLVGSVFEYLGSANAKTIQTAPLAYDPQPKSGSDNNDIIPSAESSPFKPTTDTIPSFSVQAVILKLYENLSILWASVAFALLIRKITMYQSFVRFVKAGRTEVSDIGLLNALADTGESIGVKRPVELFVNPLISSPMLLGFFRPYIILPGIDLDHTELICIMRHELTHYRNLDMFYKWLVQITVCLHWFNPFAYLMAKEINLCCELSCDEAIIRTMDRDEIKAYGDTLLNALKAIGNYHDKLAAATLTEGAQQLKERLDAIMKFKKISRLTGAVSLALTLVFVMGSAAIGAYAAPPASAVSKNNGIAAAAPQAHLYDSSAKSPQQLSVASSGILSNDTKALTISFDIDNGGVELLPADSNEIKAIYDSTFYNVDITNRKGEWNINISGKVSMMGKTKDVQLYIPDVTRTMNVKVLDGNFSYALPENCTDKISITAQNAGIDFSSKNQYKNSAVSLTATDKDFIKYEPPVYPSYFTKTDTGFEYHNGTGENKIDISLTGYTNVSFKE